MKIKLLFLLTCFLTQKFIIANPGGDPPVANFSFYIEFVGATAEVSFLNESIDGESYYWDFGDGTNSTDLHPFHAYPEPGIYIVCLTTTNDFGTDTFCDTVLTYYAPSADFMNTGDPLVTFTDLTTNSPTTWDWFFGDGEISNIQNPEHLYLANGDYNVCLSAGNPGGTSYTCKIITISGYPVTVAAFSYTGDPEVSFTDLSSESPYAWFWDFGDGTTSIEQNPTHDYADNGTYSVCLTATNAGGTNTICQDVVIEAAVAPPVAAYSYLVIGLQGVFVDESAGDPATWEWDFGDGEISTEQNPVHEFDEEGSFIICLTATNAGGSDTECKELMFETGIIDENISALHIFPNPVKELLFVELNNFITNGELNIYDNTGKIISNNKLSGDQLIVDIEQFTPGIYYLVLYEKGKVVGGKTFVKK